MSINSNNWWTNTSCEYHEVAAYSKLLAISPKYLSECVLEVLSVSAKSIIVEQLLMRSRHQLKFSDKTIKEISFELGFSSPDYFSYFFKAHTGSTPSTIWKSVDPGVGIPPHIHTREDEIFRVIKGQIEIMVDGKTSILNAGDVAFAPKAIPHSWKAAGTEKTKMITSAFQEGIEHMFRELAELPAGPPDFEKVAAICAKQGISFI